MKLDDVFTLNFMIATYGSMAAIDNDDTSAHYETHHNVCECRLPRLLAPDGILV